ncbi:hypothetical protein [Aeromonas salmonicida]|uniref:hypothetical protein n=1 Tax=Aeromonas salmonicida TaxID=645 RepID=UPI0012D8C4DB|nr:hypothetical protein [Aeromonas salmonicida]
MKRFTHDADLRGMVVLRSLGFQLVPFKLHRFRKQRPLKYNPSPSPRLYSLASGLATLSFESVNLSLLMLLPPPAVTPKTVLPESCYCRCYSLGWI